MCTVHKVKKIIESNTSGAREKFAASISSVPIRSSPGNLLIYPRYRIIFNRIKKAANSSILMYNADVFVFNSGGSDLQSDGYKAKKSEAISLGKQFSSLKMRELMELKRYIKFTAVRNPYTRLLSAFRQKIIMKAIDDKNSSYRCIPGYADDSPEGFRNFVTFLEKDGLYCDRHWWPQKDLLAIPLEWFDFVVHVENLSEELPAVYKSAALIIPDYLELSRPHRAESNDKAKITESSAMAREYYDEELMERVARLYAPDFESFGYSLEALP